MSSHWVIITTNSFIWNMRWNLQTDLLFISWVDNQSVCHYWLTDVLKKSVLMLWVHKSPNCASLWLRMACSTKRHTKHLDWHILLNINKNFDIANMIIILLLSTPPLPKQKKKPPKNKKKQKQTKHSESIMKRAILWIQESKSDWFWHSMVYSPYLSAWGSYHMKYTWSTQHAWALPWCVQTLLCNNKYITLYDFLVLCCLAMPGLRTDFQRHTSHCNTH